MENMWFTGTKILTCMNINGILSSGVHCKSSDCLESFGFRLRVWLFLGRGRGENKLLITYQYVNFVMRYQIVKLKVVLVIDT